MSANDNARDMSRLLGVLGLCVRAGALVFGTDNVCEAMRKKSPKGQPRLVIEAEGCSANTHKKLTDKCTYYNIAHTVIPVDAATLAAALGRTGELAAVGITDENLCRAVQKQLDSVR
ncbi:MAG: ribosomal L7Ae/L30e/S12e/Gadd45 family protein [Clostridia bacterium]|nr:ribosomal L7Ae/L30e/S12e/Gadd45 family protein [Clostridia bacterium]